MSQATIRPARAADAEQIFALIGELAKFEKLEPLLVGSAEKLRRDLFGERVVAEAVVAELDGRLVGFALFFANYSTFRTQAGLYLEDLFVLEEWRGRGIGKALFLEVARLAALRGAGRFEWSVLDWNERAIGFYENLGANLLKDWRICRIDGDSLGELLARRS